MSVSSNTKMPKIIAICGAKRSGKDVLAQHLVNKYNYERVSFDTGVAEPVLNVKKSYYEKTGLKLFLLQGRCPGPGSRSGRTQGRDSSSK